MKRRFKWMRVALIGLILSFSLHILFPVQAQLSSPKPRVGLEAGRQHYEAGEFSEALQLWQQAVIDARSSGNKLEQAQGLSLMSLAYQKLGRWEEAQKAIDLSWSLLETIDAEPSRRVRAQVFNAQGLLQLATGRAAQALASWEQAEKAYRQVGDRTGVMGSQIDQAKALEALGFYRRSYKTLLQAIGAKADEFENLIDEEKLTDGKTLTQLLQPFLERTDAIGALGLRSLGNILRVTGNLEASARILSQSLAIAVQLSPQEESQSLLSLANTERALATEAALLGEPTAGIYTQKALEHYQRAASQATLSSTQIQAQLNQLSLLIDTRQNPTAQILVPQIALNLDRLPASSFSVSARVNFARSLMKLNDWETAQTQPEAIAQILSQAVEQARSLKDRKAESYARGTLGNLYEEQQQWLQAKRLTGEALKLAQSNQAPEIAYQWQWQLGRIERALNEDDSAIATYLQAVKTLRSLRSDLVALNPNAQYNFRDEVEPIYRQAAALLLKTVDELEPQQKQERLNQAREVIESLQLAELDNFFRDACLQEEAIDLDEVIDRSQSSTAAIYAIILADRLEVIVKLPQRSLLHYKTENISQTEVENTLNNLLESLKEPIRTPQLTTSSQKVYNWLLRQAEPDLSSSNIKNLVFVLDKTLRNLPMAVLDDGHQYLIEKYAVVLSPGLKFVDPKPLSQKPLTALIGGIYEEGAPSLRERNLQPSPLIEKELKQIQQEIPTESLTNESFTKINLQKRLRETNFSIVHLATHGQFSSNAAKTYILAWDSPITLKEMYGSLQSRTLRQKEAIELLVLSACQTAAGDNRAVLGLAGVAVRSGARSTLATLWQVEDRSAEALMSRFYQVLKNHPSLTKAQALQQAQLYLLHEYGEGTYQLPYSWAPFVLVGNWL